MDDVSSVFFLRFRFLRTTDGLLVDGEINLPCDPLESRGVVGERQSGSEGNGWPCRVGSQVSMIRRPRLPATNNAVYREDDRAGTCFRGQNAVVRQEEFERTRRRVIQVSWNVRSARRRLDTSGPRPIGDHIFREVTNEDCTVYS